MFCLSCENLILGYEGRQICAPLSFSVNEGDYVCILGENGSGKTTLMKTLLGLQKPLGGTIEFAAEGIGYLPQQDATAKDFPASVREIVRSGCIPRTGLFYSRESKERAERAMAKLGLAEIAGRGYRTLSGGQQQRVLLARALCAADRVLLLDEPAAALDAQAADGLYDTLRTLHGQGVTILMISHDAHAALREATHILCIDAKEAFFGAREQYMSHLQTEQEERK